MIAQVVFFLAVVLVLVLLLRRASFLGGVNRTAAQWAVKTKEQVFQAAERLQTTTKNRRSSRPLSVSQAPKVPIHQGEGHFWQEEHLEDKPELSSHFEEGDTLFRAGQYQEAEQFFLKAATSHPNDAKIYARLGLIYLNLKNYSDAIESLKVAAKIDKYNPSRHYNLALAYFGKKDVQHAIVSAREAISLDPVTGKYRQFLDELLKGGDKIKLP